MNTKISPPILRSEQTSISLDMLKKESVMPLYKPLLWTSFQLVQKIRFLMQSKVGHAGTLDPLASGLMILGIGKGTKQLTQLFKLNKTYQAEITLGAVTDSYDLEKPPQKFKSFSHLNHRDITKVVDTFEGEIMQKPPIFSAIKRAGKKMYELAREGMAVEPAARLVHIHQINVIKIDLPRVSINVSCSSGTYIRSLAHDIGQQLDCGAYLSKLNRTHIGSIALEDAFTWQELQEWCHDNQKG